MKQEWAPWVYTEQHRFFSPPIQLSDDSPSMVWLDINLLQEKGHVPFPRTEHGAGHKALSPLSQGPNMELDTKPYRPFPVFFFFLSAPEYDPLQMCQCRGAAALGTRYAPGGVWASGVIYRGRALLCSPHYWHLRLQWLNDFPRASERAVTRTRKSCGAGNICPPLFSQFQILAVRTKKKITRARRIGRVCVSSPA